MSATISVRIQPRRGTAQLRGTLDHDRRTGRIPEYVDRTRSGQNSLMHDSADLTPARLAAEHRRRLTAQRYTQRTAAALSGLITFSKAAQPLIEALTPAEQDRLYGHVAQRLSQALDVPLRLVAAHRDETAPHAHFLALNVTSCGKTFRGDRRAMSQLQDVAAAACQELGLAIGRGVPKLERIRRGQDRHQTVHRSVRQLHRDLPLDIARARQRLVEQERRARHTQRRLAAGRENLARLQQRHRGYERRIARAKALLERLARPRPVSIERLKKRARRFGFERTETVRIKVYRPAEVDRLLTALSDTAAQALQRAERAERAVHELGLAREQMRELGGLLHAAGVPVGPAWPAAARAGYEDAGFAAREAEPLPEPGLETRRPAVPCAGAAPTPPATPE